jgi:hypothetical protein
MQQDDEDRKNEIIVEGFEDKIKKLEDSLKEKDSLLRSAEGSLAEARAQNEKIKQRAKGNSNTFEREFKSVQP